jgi:hypothetical protein
LLHELATVIEDVRRFQRQGAESGTGAFMTARLAASVRDWDRYTIGLGEVASLFAGWLINAAPGVTEHDRLEAASQAVTGLGDDALALELRELVEAYAGGSLTEGEFVGRLKEAEHGRLTKPLRQWFRSGQVAFGSRLITEPIPSGAPINPGSW